MTLLDTAPCTDVPTDVLVAGVAWLQSFDPWSASVPELDHAQVLLGRVRSFADAVSLRVDAARQRASRATGSKVEPLRPGSGSAAEHKRRRDAAVGAERASSLADALERGEVSVDHLAALGRVRNHECVAGHETELLAAATARSADEFVRWLRDVDDAADRARGVDLDEQRRSRRSLGYFEGEFGMGGTRLLLEPLQHSLLRDAVFRMSDELWRNSGDRSSTPAQRMADALVELVARGSGLRPTADAGPTGADAVPKRPRRATMLVHITEESLFGRLDAAGLATAVDGTRISAAEARRLACTAELLPVVLGGDGRVLDIGRAGRYATDAQWQTLLVRDGGCVVAGCGAVPSWCDAHHCAEWEHGGTTDLHNLCLLCAHHHRMLHTNGWSARVDGGYTQIVDANGTPIPTRNRNGPAPPCET